VLKGNLLIVLYCLNSLLLAAQQTQPMAIEFYGDSIVLPAYAVDTTLPTAPTLARFAIQMAAQFEAAEWKPMADSLLQIKKRWQLDDWIFYQLIRKTAQQVSPKNLHFERYTVLKWFLLTRCGYDATLKADSKRLLLYVHSPENVFNIPNYQLRGKQYICLNYHDFDYFDIDKEKTYLVALNNSNAERAFSYRVNRIPTGRTADYIDKELQFNDNGNENRFTIKLNPALQQLFTNYPAVDYESYFNIPLSQQTYQSLIPALKKKVEPLSVKKGIDFIMRFTRYSFLFENDSLIYGKEKRLSPEQTLLYKYSDCEDRVALFFYLVKEIYNLPMIVLSYPRHVAIAVKLNKPVGKPIIYNGEKYTLAEPTPQSTDLALGRLPPSLKKVPYEIVYSYLPNKK
jgi:hypothetical protein